MAGTRTFHDITLNVTDIDRRKCTRQVPMKILVLGMCRTGTDSMRQALKILGFNDVYHGYTATLENARDCRMWLDACAAKYEGIGKPFGKAEFDQLLGHCQAISDFPALAFAPELIDAYPEAKVILTLRDADSWYDSMMKTFQPLISSPWLSCMIVLDNIFLMQTRWIMPLYKKLFFHFFRGSFPRNGKEVFAEHYENMRKLVPKERLLEYNVVDGWGPLCKFLGEENPNVAFPTGNGVESFQLKFRSAILQAFGEYATRTAKAGVFIGFLLWAIPKVSYLKRTKN